MSCITPGGRAQRRADITNTTARRASPSEANASFAPGDRSHKSLAVDKVIAITHEFYPFAGLIHFLNIESAERALRHPGLLLAEGEAAAILLGFGSAR